MSMEFLHQDELLRPTDYSPAAVTTGSRLILLAGQAAAPRTSSPPHRI